MAISGRVPLLVLLGLVPVVLRPSFGTMWLWLLLVVSVIATFAYVGRRRWRQLNAQAGQRAGEARLAERFAAGEIEEREYEQRLATLKRLGHTG